MTVPKPQKLWLVDQLPVELYTSNEELGQAAANKAQQILKEAIEKKRIRQLDIGNWEFSTIFLKRVEKFGGY